MATENKDINVNEEIVAQQETATAQTEPKPKSKVTFTEEQMEEVKRIAAKEAREAERKALKNVNPDDEKAMNDKIKNALALEKQKWLEEQNMTQAEKDAKREREARETLLQERISFHRELAEAKLKSAGFDDDEIEIHLENLVSEDKTLTMGKIQRICDSRKSYVEKTVAEVTAKINGGQSAPNISAKAANDLQTAYDNAKKGVRPDTLKMTQIIATAKAQGIKINE